MPNHKLLIIVTLVISSGTLAYLYNPKINFDFETDQQTYTVSMENLDIYYQKENQSSTLNLKAEKTFYEPAGLILKNIDSSLKSSNRPEIRLTADEGFWPHQSDQIFLFGHVLAKQETNSLLAHQLVIDLKNGMCFTDQEVTWAIGQIQATSPSLHEKILNIQNILNTQEP